MINDKLNDKMKIIRMNINHVENILNYTENKLNYSENLIIAIQKNMNKKIMIDNEDKLYDEIQNKVHRHMGIFNSKINNTSHHNYQIETKFNNIEELISKIVENLINNKSYQIYRDLSKQLNDIYYETLAYCETTRIEELSQVFILYIQFDKLQIDIFVIYIGYIMKPQMDF